MDKKKIIIIGGGPAGLIAAGQAAEAGADVLVLEKMKLAGRKLCITGKGRCNITNIAEIKDFISHFGRSGNFLRQSFHRFFNTELMDFLDGLGLEMVKERGGRVFPQSGLAPEVLKVLLRWVKEAGVKIQYSAAVETLITRDGKITAVYDGTVEYPCDAVILATGGSSYPLTGSTGDGYRLAQSVGHTIIPIRPALVPLEAKGTIAGRMDGLNLRNIKIRMLVNGKKRREVFGEVVFAKFGLTGPAILTLSGDIVDRLEKKEAIVLSLDLKPALDEKKLDNRLLRDFKERHREQFDSILRGLLPREMVPVCLALTAIPAERLGNSVTVEERRRLRTWLKDFRFEITRARPLAEAIVTAGGVDTREVDPRTMESRLMEGLFLAGEVLDIQADTGGYNLQAAFSTGWLAGKSASLNL